MINVKLKIINNSTTNEINYDLSKFPNLNQMYEWTWNNFLDYLILYTPPKNKIYIGEKKFKIELYNSNNQINNIQIQGISIDDLTKEEVFDFVIYVKSYEPSIKHTKTISLRRTKKR